MRPRCVPADTHHEIMLPPDVLPWNAPTHRSSLEWRLRRPDIIITQDHNHSTVSGDVAHYPLRAIVDGGVGAHDPHGYSVSGFVRTAELLTRDGLQAYDGAGWRDIPILSGITVDGTHLYPDKDDQHGKVCGRAQKSVFGRALLEPRPKESDLGGPRSTSQRKMLFAGHCGARTGPVSSRLPKNWASGPQRSARGHSGRCELRRRSRPCP
jgi:hypothetical protein